VAYGRAADTDGNATVKRINFLLRLAVGGVFVYAGAMKILHPQLFAHEIDQYGLLPHAGINLLAITLPWVELAAGLVLVLGVWVRAGALVVTGLSIVFLLAIISVLARGLKIKCGCFGTVGESFIGPWNLVLDILLLAAAVWICRGAKEEK
jgi:putative oxidoreductase